MSENLWWLLDRMFGPTAKEPPRYQMILMAPDGKQIAKRSIRVWPDDPEAVKTQFSVKGAELGVDANYHVKGIA